jgi:beta-N-acetylhexosaminidase
MEDSSPKAAIVGIAGPVLTTDEVDLLRRLPPAGVILFRRNIVDPAQLVALNAGLRAVLPPGAVIMVDQEGGRVARLRPPHWMRHPAIGAIGALYVDNAKAGRRAAWLQGALIGAECAAMGFDTVCAPVLDLRLVGMNEVVGDRGFCGDPEAVAQLGREVAEGLLAAGVQPVVKHAPGHGRARVDSHEALPVVDEGDLALDLLPFGANADLPWMMTAHLVYRGYDPVRPGTLSPVVLGEVIRGRIGFEGVLVSDDLAMGALSGTPVSRCLAALAAGCDVALYCPGALADNIAVLEAVPVLSVVARARLAAAREMAAARRMALDPARLLAERDGLGI